MNLPEAVDGAIFSLSYCVMRDRKQALRHAWQQLEPGGRLVIAGCENAVRPVGRFALPAGSLDPEANGARQSGHRRVKDLNELTGLVEVEELQFRHLLHRLRPRSRPAAPRVA